MFHNLIHKLLRLLAYSIYWYFIYFHSVSVPLGLSDHGLLSIYRPKTLPPPFRRASHHLALSLRELVKSHLFIFWFSFRWLLLFSQWYFYLCSQSHRHYHWNRGIHTILVLLLYQSKPSFDSIPSEALNEWDEAFKSRQQDFTAANHSSYIAYINQAKTCSSSA